MWWRAKQNSHRTHPPRTGGQKVRGGLPQRNVRPSKWTLRSLLNSLIVILESHGHHMGVVFKKEKKKKKVEPLSGRKRQSQESEGWGRSETKTAESHNMWSGRAFPPQVAAYAAQKEEARASVPDRLSADRRQPRQAGKKDGAARRHLWNKVYSLFYISVHKHLFPRNKTSDYNRMKMILTHLFIENDSCQKINIHKMLKREWTYYQKLRLHYKAGMFPFTLF